MQRTMIAGPARRRSERRSRSNAASKIHMFVMHIRRKQLREDVRPVVVRSNLAHLVLPCTFRSRRSTWRDR
eukprot:4303999-Pleurochrysis_carterae.AAC.1